MTYTLIAGTKEWSSWSLRPYMALRHIGVAFKEEVIPLRQHTSSTEVQKRSRSGRVPVLEIEEKGERYFVWEASPSARRWPIVIPKESCSPTIPRRARWYGPIRRKCIRAFPMCATS